MISLVASVFMAGYVTLAAYTFMAHFAGRHRRCRGLAFLLAAASPLAFFALSSPADPAIRALQSPLQAATFITLILSPLGGLVVLLQKMADEQPQQYIEGDEKEELPLDVSMAQQVHRHAIAAGTLAENVVIQPRIQSTAPGYVMLPSTNSVEGTSKHLNQSPAKQKEQTGRRASREDLTRAQQAAKPVKEKRIPQELTVKNLINSGVYDLRLAKQLIKILRNNPRLKDHLEFIRWSDVKTLYGIGDKGKKIKLTRRAMKRLIGLRLIEERDGRLFLTERGKKIKMAAVEAAIALRERLQGLSCLEDQ